MDTRTGQACRGCCKKRDFFFLCFEGIVPTKCICVLRGNRIRLDQTKFNSGIYVLVTVITSVKNTLCTSSPPSCGPSEGRRVAVFWRAREVCPQQPHCRAATQAQAGLAVLGGAGPGPSVLGDEPRAPRDIGVHS